MSNNIRNKYLNNNYEGLPKVDKIDFNPCVQIHNTVPAAASVQELIFAGIFIT